MQVDEQKDELQDQPAEDKDVVLPESVSSSGKEEGVSEVSEAGKVSTPKSTPKRQKVVEGDPYEIAARPLNVTGAQAQLLKQLTKATVRTNPRYQREEDFDALASGLGFWKIPIVKERGPWDSLTASSIETDGKSLDSASWEKVSEPKDAAGNLLRPSYPRGTLPPPRS